MKYFRLIGCNLKRHRLRTLLTLLSILVAFLLYGFLCTIKYAMTGGVNLAHADRLFTANKVALVMPLPVNYLEQIEKVPGVTAAMHETWFGGIYQDPKNFLGTFPVEPESFLAIYPEYILAPDQKKKWLETRNGAIVGRTTADRFGWKIGDHVPITSPIWGQPAKEPAWDFEIVGIYDGATKGTDTSQFFFRYDFFDEGRQQNKGQVGWFIIQVANPNQADAVGKAVDALFANSSYETKTATEAAMMRSFAQQVGDISTILISILGAVFFTILLVAGNTMAQSVRERTTELGVLKALGFRNEMVLGLVLAESCLVTALGGLTGLGLAWLVTLRGSPVPQMLPVFYLPTHDIVVGVGLVFVLGVAAGLLPAIQAMRLPVAVALRRMA
jgi:putative ABC transport system permease protein